MSAAIANAGKSVTQRYNGLDHLATSLGSRTYQPTSANQSTTPAAPQTTYSLSWGTEVKKERTVSKAAITTRAVGGAALPNRRKVLVNPGFRLRAAISASVAPRSTRVKNLLISVPTIPDPRRGGSHSVASRKESFRLK